MTAELWRELAQLAQRFAEAAEEDARHRDKLVGAVSSDSPNIGGASWREQLWVVPPDTRLGVREVAEALGHSTSWVYKRTSQASKWQRLPHRTIQGGRLVFLAGEIRAWVGQAEIVKEPGFERSYLLGRTGRRSAMQAARGVPVL